MTARVHPLDFPVPDGLERLRRDRRGSTVAFHAGTIHPQNPPDKGGPAGAREWPQMISSVLGTSNRQEYLFVKPPAYVFTNNAWPTETFERTK
jgi:hypothetical protein